MPHASLMRGVIVLGTLALALACARAPVVNQASVDSPGSIAAFGEQEPREFVVAPTPSVFAGECPAALDEQPESYSAGHVTIRLPAGVDATQLVEFTPILARSTAAIEVRHCRPGQPDATILFMALVHYDDDLTRPITAIRDEMLDALGYPVERVALGDAVRGARAGTWAYEIPTSREHPELTRLLVGMSSEHGKATAIVYELPPDAWPLLVTTLVASAEQVVVMP